MLCTDVILKTAAAPTQGEAIALSASVGYHNQVTP